MLTNLSNLLVQATFDQTDAASLRDGAAATVTPQGVTTASALSATVAEIDPTSTTSSGVVDYGATLALTKPATGLKPGESVSVSVVTGEVNNALYVPATAVTTSGTTSTVVMVGAEQQGAARTGHPGRPGQHRRPDPYRAYPRGEGADVDRGREHRQQHRRLPVPRRWRRAWRAGRRPRWQAPAEEAADDERRSPMTGEPHPVIRLVSVTKIYGTGEAAVQALRGVSLDVVDRDYVAIMGASGSGKSTMMNIIGCLDVPSEGQFLIDGIDTRSLDEQQLAVVRNRKIGFVFQAFNLIPRMTALHERGTAAVLRGRQVGGTPAPGGGGAAPGRTG